MAPVEATKPTINAMDGVMSASIERAFGESMLFAKKTGVP
jgi:hypothetical protein